MQKTYIHALDGLRTLSILGVILIHTTTRVLEYTHYDLTNYKITLFFNQMVRFSVPLFFIISGFVLEHNHDTKLPYPKYLKRRFERIFLPYIFWSFIFYFFIYTKNNDGIVKMLLTGSASYQLYFIPTLCIYYLIFPFINKLLMFLKNWSGLLVFGLGILQIRIMNEDYLVRQFSYPDPVRIFLLSFFFFVLGILASKHTGLLIKITGFIKYFLAPLSIYLCYFVYKEGFDRYFKTYNIEAFYSQWRPSVLIYTIALASFVYFLLDALKINNRFINKLSKLSYLAFFIHVLVLEVIWNSTGLKLFEIFARYKVYYIFDLLLFLAVSGASFIFSYLCHKVPKLSKVTG